MTAFFQSLGMSYDWAWFVATVCGILLIALRIDVGTERVEWRGWDWHIACVFCSV